jgi:hypothetical protein
LSCHPLTAVLTVVQTKQKLEETEMKNVGWINLAQNENKGRIFVNRVVNIGVLHNSAILLGRKMM